MPERSPAARRREHLTSRAPVVLLYHGFTERRRDDDPENLFVEVGEFEAQLTWLLAQGWRPLDLDAYLRWRETGVLPARRSFLVTIDDALCSVAELALEVLVRLDVPAVLYVPSDLVGGTASWLPLPADEPLLHAAQLRALAASPVMELGLHGADHRDLRGLDPVELERQVAGARVELAELLRLPVRTFAYPFGAHDEAARTAVRDAGFASAFSVYDDAGPLAVSRVDVNATDTGASFRLKMRVPGYRRAWQVSERFRFLRRGIRAVATRRSAAS